jgi:hypothetical protein
MKILVLGLFNWNTKILVPSELIQITDIIFNNNGTIKTRDDGWYVSDKEFPITFEGNKIDLMVSYSRLIARLDIKIDGPGKTEYNLNRIFEVRRELMNVLNDYMEKRLEKISRLKFIQEKFPGGINLPMFFSYVLVILDSKSHLFQAVFRRDKDRDWNGVPFDVSTTNFFTVVADVRSKWYLRDLLVPMRIGGGILIMGESSYRFLHRVINLIYYVGMTRIIKEVGVQGNSFVFRDGLMPIVGNIGEEMSSSLIQRTTEERLQKLNKMLILFTFTLISLTGVLVVFSFYAAGIIRI